MAKSPFDLAGSDIAVTLLFVRLHLGKKCLDVALDDNGTKRMVQFKWAAKSDSDVPPDHWYELAVMELRFQDSEKKRGMIGGY